MKVPEHIIGQSENLITDIRQLILETRQQLASFASMSVTTLYWHIGERINREILGNQRAEYGKKLCRHCLHNYRMNMVDKSIQRGIYAG